MVKLTINGKEIQASPTQTILQVCHDQKIDQIPTLCYDPKLPPFGSCFLCIVEAEGQKKLFPACSTKVAEGMNIQTRSEKVLKARKTCLELLLSDHYADCFGPCRLSCPADVDIQGYMSLIHLGKFTEAIALIKETNPFPSMCGRVCTRKCEINCRRAITDTPVGIDFLKRYAADQDMIGEMWQPEVKPDNGHQVAIIGGGPAGLTCAYYLIIEGYRPTIFEALPKPGGMLRYGIPEYRLPKDVLDKEINWILDLGIELKTGQMLGRDFSLDELFNKGFEAVFVGLGAQVGKPMRVEGEEVDGVLSGVEFLQQVEMKTNPDIKGRVVVVGGGNTAIDAARTSLRLGADEVILLYRRTRKEMPANEMEIVAAEEEGINMEFLAAPVQVHAEDGRMKSIECLRMQLGEPDDSGRRRPVKIEGSEYRLEADWIISAIGQEPDLNGVDDDNTIQTTRWKTIEAKPETFHTDRPGVFAGGDVVTAPADAIYATAADRIAADAVDRYIRTSVTEPLNSRFESKRDNFHKITPEDLPEMDSSLNKRHHMPELEVADRISNFREVETGFTAKQALEESIRCAECGCDVGLSCALQDYCTEYGVDQTRFVGEYSQFEVDTRHPFIKIDSNKCIRCGRCVSTCSEIINVSALGFVNRGFRTIVKPALDKALHETNCVSCGNCIDVCPTGALVEKMEFRRMGPWKMDANYNVCNYCSVGCNITVQSKTADLFFVTGAPPDAGPNRGELCVKGRFGYQHYLDGSRLTKPMVRKDGNLVEASWDEAFEAIKTGLNKTIKKHGPDHVMVSASPKLSNEELYLAGRMARAGLGSNNITSFHRMLNGADYHATDEMIGATVATATEQDLADADLYLFVGGNPCAENPVLGWQMKRRIRNGAEAIVINSAEIDMVSYASVWADCRRGTATALLNGVIGELIRMDKYDKDYVAAKTENFDQIKTELVKHDLNECSSITGVHSERLEKIVQLLSEGDKKIVAFFNIDSRIDRADSDLKALTTLMLLLGKIGAEGSGIALTSSQSNHTGSQLAGFDCRLLPGLAPIDDAGLKEVGAVWRTDLAGTINGSKYNLSEKMAQNKIRAAVILGENPAAEDQFGQFVDGLDFLVVADMFRTETVDKADVVLPLCGYLETEGHLTNWAGTKQAADPIGEPRTGMSNAELITKLSALAEHEINFNSFDEIVSEIDFLQDKIGLKLPKIGTWPTPEKKAQFVAYSQAVSATGAKVTDVLEIDARMAARMKQIRT